MHTSETWDETEQRQRLEREHIEWMWHRLHSGAAAYAYIDRADEMLARVVVDAEDDDGAGLTYTQRLAAAQVQATLALAAAALMRDEPGRPLL
jgi:hypothetical protein